MSDLEDHRKSESGGETEGTEHIENRHEDKDLQYATDNDESQDILELEDPVSSEPQSELEELLFEVGDEEEDEQLGLAFEEEDEEEDRLSLLLEDGVQIVGSPEVSEGSPKYDDGHHQSISSGEDNIFGDFDMQVVKDAVLLTVSDDELIDHSEEEDEERKLSVGEKSLSGGEASDDELRQIPEEPARNMLDALAASLPPRMDSIFKDLQLQASNKQGNFPLPSDSKYTSSVESVMERCPSRESFFRQKKMVEVQLYLYPGERIISRDCRLDVTVGQLKNALSSLIKVPVRYLDIRRKLNLVSDHKTLFDLGATPQGKIFFTVEINKRAPGKFNINLPKDKEEIAPKIETRTVQVTDSQGVRSTVQVTIEYSTELKPKLGGMKDARTNQRFLHAATMPDRIDAERWELSEYHKGCQTFYSNHASTQTKIDAAQQMEREDYYVSRIRDRTLRAKKYVTWEELQRKREVAAITLQRYWRGYLGRLERKQRLEALVKRVEWMENSRKERVQSRFAIMENELSRQECPSRMVDLELLYRAINQWRQEQEEYVMANRWGAERKAAMAMLTEMEVDLLQDLERTRKRIQDNNRERVVEAKFQLLGEPKRWLGRSDTFIVMDTKERANVRQLHRIYKDMKAPVIGEGEEKNTGVFTIKERLELLEKVNEMIKKHRNRTGLMLAELITREMTYIKMNCSKALLLSLRKRMSNCFFLLCQDPIFNPEAKKLHKAPFDLNELRKNMMQCKGCKRMCLKEDFTIHRGTKLTSICNICTSLYRTSILRLDLNLYRHMLDELRREELLAGVTNSVTFLIDASDMQFLVEQIWHGQSALSGITNRYLFRLCRWIKDKPWTPWNCVLLLEEEAVSHLQLDNMEIAYRDSFVHKVLVTQHSAKMHFQGISKLALGLDNRIAEDCARYFERQRKKLAREKFKKKTNALHFLRRFKDLK